MSSADDGKGAFRGDAESVATVICEPCQGSGYNRKFLGRGTVELKFGDIKSVGRGSLMMRKDCTNCGGSGRVPKDDENNRPG